MDVFSNVDIAPETVTRIFGSRTLVLANNTHKEGYYFKDVFLWVQRKGYTSIISINPKEGPVWNDTVGIFFGTNVKGLRGVKFEGKTRRDGKNYSLVLAKVGAEIIEEDEVWFLDGTCGWVSLGDAESYLKELSHGQKVS